jgi:hypothetical protein
VSSSKAPKKVYREEKSNGLGLAFSLGFFAMVGTAVADVADGTTYWGIVAAVALFGFVVGRALKTRRCSGCRGRLNGSAERCITCGGIVVGVRPG